MSYKLDYKVTAWRRISIDTEEEMLKIKAMLDNNEIVNAGSVADELETYSEEIDCTDEEMNIEENNGLPTIEILDEEGNTIWHNGTDEHYFNNDKDYFE